MADEQSTPQTCPPNQPAQPDQRKNKANRKLIIFLIGCVVAIPLTIIIIIVIIIAVSLPAARGKAGDAQIRSNVSSLRSYAEVYYEQNNTYRGWTAEPAFAQDVRDKDSEVVIQGLSEQTYVIYADLPYANKIFCVDKAGFAGEINAILPTQKTCQ